MIGKKILILTGGTGGHIFPAVSLYYGLEKEGYNVKLISDKRGAGYLSALKNTSNLKIINAASLKNEIGGLLNSIFRNFIGFMQSLIFILRYKPDLVVSFGGYATFAPILITCLMRIPFIIHEQNSVIGKVNLQMAKFAKKILLGMPVLNSGNLQNIAYVGNPVRREIEILDNEYPSEDEGIIITIIGGSQGAAIFGYIVPEALGGLDENLKRKIKIVYQHTIEEDLYRVSNYYKDHQISCVTSKFFENMGEIFQKSHLIIARSGASTIAEICAIGRATIFVPYPYASADHQYYNAKILEEKNACIIIKQSELTAQKLRNIVAALIEEKGRLKNMAENARKLYVNANDKILQEVRENL